MEWLFSAAVVVGFLVFIALVEGAMAEIIGRIIASFPGGRPVPKSDPAIDSDNSHQVEDGSGGSQNT